MSRVNALLIVSSLYLARLRGGTFPPPRISSASNMSLLVVDRSACLRLCSGASRVDLATDDDGRDGSFREPRAPSSGTLTLLNSILVYWFNMLKLELSMVSSITPRRTLMPVLYRCRST